MSLTPDTCSSDTLLLWSVLPQFVQDLDAANGFSFLSWLAGGGSMLQAVDDIVRDDDSGNPGWSVLLDVTRCPTAMLPWLAQFVGVRFNSAQLASDALMRGAIENEQGFQRGSPAAIEAAANAQLNSGYQVTLYERENEVGDSDAYALTVAIPSAGVTGGTWAELVADYATWADVEGEFSTWGDVEGQTYALEAAVQNAVPGGIRVYFTTGGITPTVPGTPTHLLASAGDTEVILTWDAPSDGGSSITSYEVYENGGSTPIASPTTTSYTVTGLTNGTEYSFTVAAVNDSGTGPQSSSASATPATAPGAPTRLSATAANEAVDLSWTAPSSDGGSSITSYEVYENGGSTPIASPTTTSYTVTGLTNGTEYSFTVAAVNDSGTGPQSSSASATPATAPGAPTRLSATAANEAVDLSWTAPSSDGGSSITSYEVYENGGSTPIASPTTTSYTVTGLTNGTEYSFTVAAVNDSGTGPQSSSASATPATAGYTPTGPTGTWSLVWDDEFDDAEGMSGASNGLALSKWNCGWYYGPSNAGGTGYDGKSFTDSSGGGAIEFYGPGALTFPEDGGMEMSCFAEGDGPDGDYDSGGHTSNYESGGVNTAGLMLITPNTSYDVPSAIEDVTFQAESICVEIDCQMPGDPDDGSHDYWAFIGFYNAGNCNVPDMPDSGYHEEIDVWEQLGSSQKGSSYELHFHSASSYGGVGSVPSADSSTNMSAENHVYTVVFTYSTVTLYVDGTEVSGVSPTTTECESQWGTPQYLNILFQLKSGYTATGAGSPAATPFIVNSVRVFTQS